MTINAQAAEFGDRPMPMVDRAPGPIATGFAELNDRHQLVTVHIDQLDNAIARLIERLDPVLPSSGVPGEPTEAGGSDATPKPIDDRGMVARSLSSEAAYAQRHVDHVGILTRLVERLTDALEV